MALLEINRHPSAGELRRFGVRRYFYGAGEAASAAVGRAFNSRSNASAITRYPAGA